MDAFSSSPLAETFPSGRFGSPDASPTPAESPSPTKTEVDFPADVDQSFNSSMSISTTGDSPPPSPSMSRVLSPTPTFVLKPPRRPELSGQSLQLLSSARTNEPLGTRARPLGPARTFGRELSLNTRPLNFAQPSFSEKGKMLPPAVPENKTAASPVRMQWTLSHEDMSSPRVSLPHMGRRDSAPTLESPRHISTLADSMDVDSPRRVNQSPSMDGSPGLGSFFCESPAAPSAVPPSKRRTLVASSPASPSSSPSTRRNRPDKVVSSGALLFGVGSRANTVASRRSVPYTKRPSLTPVAPADGSRAATSTSSAYPILYGPPKGFGLARGVPTMRRAFSVSDQHATAPEGSESESEFEASPSVNPTAAEYQRRYGPSRAVLPRIDGSPGLKVAKSSTSGPTSPVPPLKSPYGPGGLPGFGDNEVDGKVLPCHKVKEDGLVRITPQTMTDLLAGKYDTGMKRYHILDCRFDYEFEGGHIDGAINVRSMEQLDELLLTAACGVNTSGSLPQPSRSGQADAAQQVVLVFHCEFSAKRAPTFAKHLRSRDRMLNNSIYPKIFYPELYILEGGYCDFFKKCPTRCEPQSYVPMDDPRHFERRNSDLHDFRKFSRTRSFTYGELQPGQQASRSQPCPPLVYAAASAATSRRGGNGATITEEHEPDSSGCEASPCPRALSMGQAPIFGSAKGRAAGRGLQRFNSYAGASLF